MSQCPALGVRTWPARWLMAMVILVTFSAMAPCQTLPTIVRVEQDWELQVGTPSPQTDAPQIVCVISPTENVEGLHAAFELNQQTLPSYVRGGLQLQVWNGETSLAERKFPNNNVLALTDETITWTMRMNLAGTSLTFEVVNGQSRTWGAFGGQGYLQASVQSTTLTDLNGYNPQVSVDNSGAGFAGNLVKSLTLKESRLYTATGETLVDSTPRNVYVFVAPQ